MKQGRRCDEHCRPLAFEEIRDSALLAVAVDGGLYIRRQFLAFAVTVTSTESIELN